MSVEQRHRHFEVLGPKLGALIRRVEDLPGGYAFEFPGDDATLQLVTAWADGERLCCPFFSIDQTLDREANVLRLRLIGEEGAKQVMQAELPYFFETA